MSVIFHSPRPPWMPVKVARVGVAENDNNLSSAKT